MYYHTPKMENYLNIVLKYRLPIIAFYFFIVIIMGIFHTPKFLTSNALFWLKNSQYVGELESKKYATHRLSKLVVTVDDFDDTNYKALNALHKKLEKTQGVEKVYSLFSSDFVESQTSHEDSQMLAIISTDELNPVKLRKLVQELDNNYGNTVDETFKTFYYFISSDEYVDIGALFIPGEYTYTKNDSEIDWYVLGFYTMLALLFTLFIFRLLFRSHVAFISAALLITFSTVLTFTSIVILTGIDTIHISMLFIAISITLVEFLYFYYRWHVSQYKNNEHKALIKMLTRSMPPAMWTSVITVLGLGSLVFIDSDIIKLLSLSVILSSVIGYFLNLTFLPAFLSYLKVEHAHVPYVKVGYMLTMREIHYNKKFLFAFLGLTYMLILMGFYMIYGQSNSFFKLNVKNEQVELKIPYNTIDLKFVKNIEKFTDDLEAHFEDGIDNVVSLVTILKSLNASNTQTKEFDENALEQALFYMDLYNLSDKYFDESSTTVILNLWEINKVELIEWLLAYEDVELYFIDNATLIGSAKYNQTVLLASSLFFALLLIGLITGWIFRSKAMIFVGFTINAIPIVWFGTIVNILEVPLSLEMLIAMTISLGIASDATIHFAYKYFRLRYFGSSRKHSLEKMYFYSGIPVIIGSIILISVFVMLCFSDIHSLELIGLYSASMVLLSLLADLFVLPVMLLHIDKFQEKLRKPD